MRTFRHYRATHPMIKVDVARARHEAQMKVLKTIGRWMYSRMFVIFNAIVIIALTALVMWESYWERGYFAIGGEVLIPGFALLAYLAEKEMQRESREYKNDSN